MDFDGAVVINKTQLPVINKTQLPKFVHEMAHTGAPSANHLREGLLADLRSDRLCSAFLAKLANNRSARAKPLLTRIEQLIDVRAATACYPFANALT
jgi:hypothetical protein